MKTSLRWIKDLFEHPLKFTGFALLVAFTSLLAGGTLLDLWNLDREKIKIESRLNQTLASNSVLESKIEQAKSSDKFIAKQAREYLDLVKDDELIFIFENDNFIETHSVQR
jgi:cell division protein FtsB